MRHCCAKAGFTLKSIITVALCFLWAFGGKHIQLQTPRAAPFTLFSATLRMYPGCVQAARGTSCHQSEGTARRLARRSTQSQGCCALRFSSYILTGIRFKQAPSEVASGLKINASAIFFSPLSLFFRCNLFLHFRGETEGTVPKFHIK